MVTIPKLFREQTIELNGNEIKLRGFRGSDYVHVDMMDEIRNKHIRIEGMINRLVTATDENGQVIYDEFIDSTGIKQRVPKIMADTDLTDSEIEELHKLTDETLKLTKDFRDIRSKVAQRGIKRFYYQELNTDELDKVEDIELDEIDESTIYNTMNSVSRKRRQPSAEDGKGKQGKGKPSKKESKTSEN